MYVHAYQSYIWNLAASERWRQYGAKVVPGDLALVEAPETKDTVQNGDLEDPEAPEDINAQTRADDKAARRIARARPIKAEEVDKYSIYDIVLPTPGHDIEYPANGLLDVYIEAMAKDGLDPSDMERKQPDFSLTGSYRPLLYRPKNVKWRTLRYNSDEDQLCLTDKDRLEGKTKADGEVEGMIKKTVGGNTDVLDGVNTALLVEFELGSGCYATMALREIFKADTSSASQRERMV